tara:strand:+ start:441 stop:743 length:303 start_codon:yes stop_codon:yes gene_type:complete
MALLRVINEVEGIRMLLADEYANWTVDQAEALLEYYDQYSEDLEEDMELDTVAIRCEWSAYDSIKEALADHGSPITWEGLQEQTSTIEGLNDGSVLVHEF